MYVIFVFYNGNQIKNIKCMTKEEAREWMDIYHNLDKNYSLVCKKLIGIEVRKHGHWVKSEFPTEKYCCSVCGSGCWYYDYQGEVARSRYCPQCGAKMDKNADISQLVV